MTQTQEISLRQGFAGMLSLLLVIGLGAGMALKHLPLFALFALLIACAVIYAPVFLPTKTKA